MANRALILYASSTGNTAEKLALVLQDVLYANITGQHDLIHLDEDTSNLLPGCFGNFCGCNLIWFCWALR